jgi:hypothetical protein
MYLGVEIYASMRYDIKVLRTKGFVEYSVLQSCSIHAQLN